MDGGVWNGAGSWLVGEEHQQGREGAVESLSGRSARDRNGKPEVRGCGAWTDLEWIARPEVSEGAAKKLFLSLRSLSG
ncbi:hypothetical protein D4L85_11350 [Chryseolinea soli]|uniref:Uncharacterized protein n=1 Tax=Chryseolinea soli TaxID=2321403 RepID=A0A385SJL4_9BACT|nr:hypothetical protein D4L85_11350 [Chryseolinea soli]